ncbi:hypothetical protein N7468_007733 [Penicillium chermesinum]|uniref:Hydrophobin n=1 Tax=Penicillium chermesinum TaxID=63820 RepID=A0A9W9NWZ4_9EURO|nr:uncharacterized protein N7468_007733 [Penicillium chermesinum]KAJ5226508.1 hypothetical protein N7468_007733 [Penicillium chermesinum]KAJ6160313.1 hypothetical protein N7470_003709 [Penicillium chermesinum]
MKFFAATIFFAATAAALPGGAKDDSQKQLGQLLGQTQNKCGQNLQVKCCNRSNKSGDSTSIAKGILSGLVPNAGAGGDFGLFGECSDVPIDVPAAILGGSGAITEALSQKCKQNVACCQDTSSEANGNLVGVAIPCVSFGSLL